MRNPKIWKKARRIKPTSTWNCQHWCECRECSPPPPSPGPGTPRQRLCSLQEVSPKIKQCDSQVQASRHLAPYHFRTSRIKLITNYSTAHKKGPNAEEAMCVPPKCKLFRWMRPRLRGSATALNLFGKLRYPSFKSWMISIVNRGQ